MKRKSFDKMECPIARGLDRVGEWWSILILRDAMHGFTRFDQFRKSLGIAPNMLARRLDALVESGLLERRRYSEHPPRDEYVLTARGWDFRPVIVALFAWGNRHFASDGVQVVIADRRTGRIADPILVDRKSRLEITPARFHMTPTPAATERVKRKYAAVAAIRKSASTRKRPAPPRRELVTQADPIVIVSAVRTPLGRFQGELSSLAAPALGAIAVREAVARAKLAPERVDEALIGCVLPAGQGQAPARQAARGGGLPDSTGATTVNKVCGSGMKATMLAHDLIAAGSASIVLAGGMESMSNAPYLLPKARSGYRFGHERVLDHMLLDGLEDAYEGGRAMGDFGEATAEAYQFTRADQDAYAAETLTRARNAVESGAFKSEIVPVTVAAKGGSRLVENDENPLKVTPDKIPGLKPAFRPTGTITAASSSANADGAAALILTKRSLAERDGLPVLAEIKAHATHSQDPAWFTTAPIPAIRKLLEKAGWSVERRRSVRDQRGLRRRCHGGSARSRNRARSPQRQRRRLRARPPDRRDRGAHHCHAPPRPRAARTSPWRGVTLHRWRRSNRHRHRAHPLICAIDFSWGNDTRSSSPASRSPASWSLRACARPPAC